MTITIADGRGALWQWDTGRRVKIADGDGVKQIHYQNRALGGSVDVDVGTDGTAIIPDELLQDCHTLTAYAYVTDDTGAYTMAQRDFIVHKRAKPAGYVYTPTEQLTLQTIQRQIGDLADLTTEAKGTLVAAINEAARTGGASHAAIGYTNGKRLSTSAGIEKDNAGSCVTGFIPCKAGSAVRIRPLSAPSSAGIGTTAVVFYDSERAMATASYIITSTAGAHFANCSWEQESSEVYKVTFGSDIPAKYKYVRFTLPIADGASAYVTYDAEMPSA